MWQDNVASILLGKENVHTPSQPIEHVEESAESIPDLGTPVKSQTPLKRPLRRRKEGKDIIIIINIYTQAWKSFRFLPYP